MNTFLPYANFARCAKALDRQRLGKQRVEAWQILKTLRYGGAWAHHPAVLMWCNHQRYLALYGQIMCDEWAARGYVDNMHTRFKEFTIGRCPRPPWLGNPAFHLSHQSKLIQKKPDHYRPIFGSHVPDDLPYVWPVTLR